MRPVVRSDSLAEKGDSNYRSSLLFLSLQKLEVSARATLKPTGELFSQRSTGKCGPKATGFQLLSKTEKAEEDRRFECHPLKQRVGANRCHRGEAQFAYAAYWRNLSGDGSRQPSG
jgi:hypothetical protein